MKRLISLIFAGVVFASTALSAEPQKKEDVGANKPDNRPVFGSMQFNHQPENMGAGLENIGTQDSVTGLVTQQKDESRESVMTALIEREQARQMAGQVPSASDEASCCCDK